MMTSRLLNGRHARWLGSHFPLADWVGRYRRHSARRPAPDRDRRGPLPHWPGVQLPPTRVAPRLGRLASHPSPLNDHAEAGNIGAKGNSRTREPNADQVRQIVRAQLSRGSGFIAMLAVTRTQSRRDRRDQWSSTFSNSTARAVRSSPSPSSLWRRARLSGQAMIELPMNF